MNDFLTVLKEATQITVQWHPAVGVPKGPQNVGLIDLLDSNLS